MGIAPSHFEEHQQREEEEQSAKALMMMNAHHARSISFGEEIPSDLECTICAEVRVYSFVSEITLLGVTCFSRARARAASRAQKRRGKESERECQRSVCLWRFPWRCETEETMRRMQALLSLSFLPLFSLFSLSEKARDFQSIWMLASSLFFFPFSLSTSFSHLRLNQITTTAEI